MRTAKRNVEISPALRDHITRVARNIRGAHGAELADVLKADSAAKLFGSIIRKNGKPVGSSREASGVSADGLGSLAGELGGLLTDAVRTGTSLLAIPITILAQQWMGTVVGPAARPTASKPQRPTAPPAPAATVEDVDSGLDASETPDPGLDEAMLRGVFRKFMPLLVSSLKQGGDGHGLAKTVITLFGRSTYDEVAGVGSDRIMRIVKADPELWAQVAPIRAEFSKFLDEFTGYDAWCRIDGAQDATGSYGSGTSEKESITNGATNTPLVDSK